MKSITCGLFTGIVAIALFAFGAPAWSQQKDAAMQPYIGGSVGGSKWSELDDLCKGDAEISDCPTNSFAAKVFGGLDFNPYFGAELGFAYLGEVSFAGTDDAGDFEADLDATSLYGALMGKVPISDSGSLFAKLGIHRWSIEFSGQDQEGAADGDYNGTDVLLGVGYRHVLENGLGIRIEWERFTLGDAYEEDESPVDEHVHVISAGVEVRF